MAKEHKAELSTESFLRYAERRYKHLRSAAFRWHTIIKELQKEIKADGKNIELLEGIKISELPEGIKVSELPKGAILLPRPKSHKLAMAAVRIIQKARSISLVDLDLRMREGGFTFNIKSLQQALKDWHQKNTNSTICLTGRGKSSRYYWTKKDKD
jgi:hypothetical protein